MGTQNLTLEKNNHIASITIDHPPANTWDLQTMTDFENAVNDVENDPEVRVVVITGQGEKCFSAGFDVKDAANAPITGEKGRDLWRRVDRFAKPVIAAINGHALGGGLELAISCHFRLMTDNPSARLGLTELNLGIIPGWGGTQRLSRIVGRTKALNMILFSETVGAEAALEMGLVDEVVKGGDVLAAALDKAKRLAERPPIAVQCVLKAMSAGVYGGPDEGLRLEGEGALIVRDTEDCMEGFAAFIEKRKPRFKGR